MLFSRDARAEIPSHSALQLPPEAFSEITRHDVVYLSTERDFARAFAHNLELTDTHGRVHERGTLYRVEPIELLGEDPDFEGFDVSFMAKSAIVLEVEEENVRMNYRDAVRAIGTYTTWDDGRPTYHPDGRLNVTWQMEQFGITQQFVDAIVKPWTVREEALERVLYAIQRRR